MANQPSLRSLLASTHAVMEPTDLLLVGLPLRDAGRLAASLPWDAGGLVSLTVDPHEASVVLPAAAWGTLAPRFPSAQTAGPYRLVTLDLVLDFAVVGYLAAVSAALAARGVSVYALSAYSRDHILVRREAVPAALTALADLAAEAGHAERGGD